MTRFAAIATTLAAIPLLGCATNPAEVQRAADRQARQLAEVEERLAGFTPGQPVTCIPTTRLRSSRNYGPAILYEVSSNLIYRNNVNGMCGNSDNDIMVTRTPTTQLCTGDIVRTIDRASRMETGGCGLGEFIPYRRDGRDSGES